MLWRNNRAVRVHGKDEEGANAMFDMGRIGINISRLRKAADLTQMELADRLNISFQAVSGWERGQSMPDISKLSELSEILGVTVDELLGNKRAAELVHRINEGEPPAMAKDEIEEVAPMLKPSQADKIVENAGLNIKQISSVAPFISEELLERIARKAMSDGGHLNDIASIMPFLGTKFLSDLVRKVYESGEPLSKVACALPFIGSKMVDEFARAALESKEGKEGLGKIAVLGPFMSNEMIDKCALKAYASTRTLSSLAPLAPFISKNTLNSIATEALERDGLNALSPIMPFLDKKVLEDYLVQRGYV